jgi:hypothetical protein
MDNRPQLAPGRTAIGYNTTATLGNPLFPTGIEQPESSLSSVAFAFLVVIEMSL